MRQKNGHNFYWTNKNDGSFFSEWLSCSIWEAHLHFGIFSKEKKVSKWRSNQQGRPGRGYWQLPFILFSHRCRHFHLQYFMLVYGYGFIIYIVNIWFTMTFARRHSKKSKFSIWYGSFHMDHILQYIQLVFFREGCLIQVVYELGT